MVDLAHPLSAFSLRDTNDIFDLLVLLVVLAALAAVWQRRPGAAILMLAAVDETTRYVRMQALTACVVVVVGGSILLAAFPRIRSWIPSRRMRLTIATAAVAMFAAVAVMRSIDLVTNHHYFAENKLSNFGTGLA